MAKGALTDFFPKTSAPTARKASASKPPAKKAAKSKAASSGDDDSDGDIVPSVVPARSAPARTSRVAAKKTYIEVDSEVEEVDDGTSSFAVDD